MRYLFTILSLLMCFSLVGQDLDVWVISNIKLTKSDKEVKQILSNPNYSINDILIYHGNALDGTEKSKINAKIKEFRTLFERVYLVPGDSDWDKLKSRELKSLGDYLDDQYKGDVIVPENACGNIEIKDLNDDISIVFMDSDWFFTDWAGDKDMNEKCEVTSRSSFWSEVNGAMGKLKAKQVLLFARSPIFRNDEIGGKLDLIDHLLPLPILGTMINDTRHYLTQKSSTLSPLYQEYISHMETILENHPQVTLISSDAEINTLYAYEDNFQVNINTSKKSSHTHEGRDLMYQNSNPSILRLEIKDKAVEAEFLDAKDGVELHSHTVINGKPFEYDASEFTDFDPSLLNEKITIKVRLEKDRVHFSNFLFGDLNKNLYDKTITVERLNLETEKGGLTPLRLGGGMQTNSMRLADKDGNVYLTRSLKKNPEKSLPPGLDIKPLKDAMANFFMAADPLAFLTTATLDSAANVYYNTPRLVHLSRQPQLAVFNDQIGDELVLFRERGDGAWPNKASFGNSENIISSSAMLDELASNDGVADANMFLRARLLDLVIGDWDRHSDQWRWAEGTGENKNVYFPIARDRDQAYANFDGFLIWLARPYNMPMLQLRKFDESLTVHDIRWMHWKSAILDNSILVNLDKENWEKETAFMKMAITEEVILKATNKLPDSFEANKLKIRKNVNARMESLDQISKDFRAELLRRGLVMASNDKDSIVIFQSDQVVKIDVFTDYNDENDAGLRSYVFDKDITEEVWIYGLAKKDVFYMTGEDDHSIDLVLVGGYNTDRYISRSKFKNIKIIDDEPKDEILSTTKTKYKFVQNKIIHDLTRFDFAPRYKFFIPKLAYNTDDGFLLGGGYSWITSGFKSTTTHNISADYLTDRRSSMLSYSYLYDDHITGISTFLDLEWSGVRRGLNFYGGNGSASLRDNNYYQVGISDIRVDFGKIKNLNRIASVSTGIYGWSVKVDDEDNLFVTESGVVNPEVFQREYFAGLKTGITLQNSDNVLRPTKLARISLSANYRYAVNAKRSNILFDFEYDYYRPLIGEDRMIFSTKLKAGHLLGDYYLYEGYQLGGSSYLRGFRNGRFTGRTILAQNTNLQLKIFNTLYGADFACSSGISLGFDHGRTWSDIDENDDWQYSYGGGLWISPLDKAVFSVGMYQSGHFDENIQLRVLFNWQF